ncbi:MAG: DUF1549 domain-containing protein [Gemmataceae bacterium]
MSIARRLLERGTRYVQLMHAGWDQHRNLNTQLKIQCEDTDAPSAALVNDLKRLGMLDETLVIWGGEFGRTPFLQGKIEETKSWGRDHHPYGFTVWLAGGGVQPGLSYGATDEFGHDAVEDKVHVHDFQATVLHLLGIDHERLTYKFQGRSFRLTDVHGKVEGGPGDRRDAVGGPRFCEASRTGSGEGQRDASDDDGVRTATCVRADGPVEYNRDVRLILAENCFACHGPTRGSARPTCGRPAATTRSNPPVPNSANRPTANSSPASTPTTSTSGCRRPRSTRRSSRNRRRRSNAGSPRARSTSRTGRSSPRSGRPCPPSATRVGQDAGRCVRPGALEARGLKPAAEADRRTLARRASLDLTGLPPDPAAVQAFADDLSPNAYERYVDALEVAALGEHRGRYWLDAARYADTHGIHFDNYREMWSYRDWVVNAFNRNLPFDQFTREQLAGDLLPNRTLDQQIASGFNRCNITTNEGGTIPEEYLVLYDRDRTETTAQVWMGLTAGCAVCHDHKFDPLTMKDFYSLAAFFNNTTQNAMDGTAEHAADRAGAALGGPGEVW